MHRYRNPWFLLLLAVGGAMSYPARLAAGPSPGEARTAAQNDHSWIVAEIEKYQTFPKVDLAMRLFKAGRVEEARRELESVLSRNPDDLNTALSYIMLLYQVKDYREIIVRTTSILTRGIAFPHGLIYRGLAYQALGERSKALDDFKTIQSQADLEGPDRLFCLETLVDLALAEKDYSLVLSASESLRRLKSSAHFEYARALALQGLGRSSEAAMVLDSALDYTQDPRERLNLLETLAMVDRLRGEWKKASEVYRRALLLDGQNPDLLRTAAETARQAGNLREAVGLMRRVIALRAEPADREYLANLFLAQQDYGAAEKQFRLCLGETREIAQRVPIYRALAELARLRNDNSEAIHLLQAVLRIGGSAEDKRWLVDLLEEQKDDSALIGELETWVAQGGEHNPDRYDQYLKLGNLYYASKDLNHALAAFRNAEKVKKTPAVMDSLAQVLEELGQIEEAITVRTEASQLQPSAANYIKIGALYEKCANPEEALQSLNAALQASASPTVLQDIYRRQGYLYAARHKQREALAAFGRAVAFGADGAELHTAIAEVYIEMRDYLQALPHLERARDLASSDRILKMLALAYSETGQWAKSAALYEALVRRVSHPSPAAEELEAKLAYVQARQKGFQEAADQFLHAFDDGSKKKAILVYWAAENYFQAQNWTRAAEAYISFLAQSPHGGSAIAAVWENLAECQEKLGRSQAAANSLENALSAGGNGRELHQRLGFLYYGLSEWRESLNHFVAAVSIEWNIQSILGAARCYQHLNKPGLSIYYLSQAAAHPGSLQASELEDILADLGNLYASVAEYDSAAGVWQKCLTLEDDPATRLQLARSRRLAGEWNAAEEALRQITPDQLAGKLRAEYFDERFALPDGQGNTQAAARILRQANEAEPAAWRDYQLGLIEMSEGRIREAVTDFRAAVDREPGSETYMQALAYAFEKAGDRQNALRMFAALADRDPDNPRWRAALAYEDVRLARNSEAVEFFRQALDRTPAGSAAAKSAQEDYGMRSEIAELDRRYDFTYYHWYVSNNYGGTPGFGTLGSALFPASSGMEVAYRPPHIGFRNGRAIQVFGRLLWSTPSNSSFFQVNQYQGSVGIRYKPLAGTNAWISMERLFHTTNFSGPGWLLRGLHSWDRGARMKVDRKAWTYLYTLSDSAYVIGGKSYLAQYEELRQGLTLRTANNLLLTPHLVEAARWQSLSGILGSYVEVGGGVSFRYLFNESRYEAPRSSFELLIQFKRGVAFRQGGNIPNDVTYDGCSVAGIVHL